MKPEVPKAPTSPENREWQALGERIVKQIRERYAALIDRLESQARDSEPKKEPRK